MATASARYCYGYYSMLMKCSRFVLARVAKYHLLLVAKAKDNLIHFKTTPIPTPQRISKEKEKKPRWSIELPVRGYELPRYSVPGNQY